MVISNRASNVASGFFARSVAGRTARYAGLLVAAGLSCLATACTDPTGITPNFGEGGDAANNGSGGVSVSTTGGSEESGGTGGADVGGSGGDAATGGNDQGSTGGDQATGGDGDTGQGDGATGGDDEATGGDDQVDENTDDPEFGDGLAFAPIHEVYAAACGSSCHGYFPADLRLSYERMVNVTAGSCSEFELITPGNCDTSLIYLKVTNPGCGGIMPPSGPAVPQEDIDLLCDWIEDGAPFDL